MRPIARGFDVVLDLAGAAAWGFGGYVLGSRLLSDQAGGVLGLAVFLSILTVMLSANLHEQRMERLIAGSCPRCRSGISYEHKHRRWDAERSEWLAPLTAWECRTCDFSHNEAWPCPQCPDRT